MKKGDIPRPDLYKKKEKRLGDAIVFPTKILK